tara:strand:- start:691 stop:1131 length:441 start_codon:yes stop_codon:yes gene_type:complete
MSNTTPSYNFITTEDYDFDKELEDLEKVYINYQENEKEYIKFIKEKTLNQLRNRRRSFQSPLPLPNLNYSSPPPLSERELPIITNIPGSNIKQIFPNKNNNIIKENKNIKTIYLTKLSFFGIVFAVNLMYYLIYYDYLNLKRITYN